MPIIATTIFDIISTGSFSLVVACALVVLLIKREILLSSQHELGVRVAKVLNVAIVPLSMLFAVTVVIRILRSI